MKTAAQVLRWEDPPHPRSPAQGGGRSRWEPLAQVLIEEAGRWAVVFEGEAHAASSLATIIRAGKVRCFSPTGSFEAVTRSHNGVATVYARHVGAES